MIKAAQVKELREKTGVGMMECKKALVENSGDIDKAILWLRERGLSRAAAKSGRTAAEGIVKVLVADDGKAAVALEVNCETDFAGKNEDFVGFVNNAAQVALDAKVTSIEQLAETSMDGSTVGEKLTGLIATVGENMTLRRLERLESDGQIFGYSHMGGKIGTLVAIKGLEGDKAEEAGQDVAMHAAAAAPKYLERSQVDTGYLDQERDLARKKLLEEGKKEEMVEKILVGQVNKLYTEVCLVDQAFVKEPKLSVAKYLKSVSADAEIVGFVRFQLGEGIEKKQENFAEEVASQLKK